MWDPCYLIRQSAGSGRVCWVHPGPSLRRRPLLPGSPAVFQAGWAGVPAEWAQLPESDAAVSWPGTSGRWRAGGRLTAHSSHCPDQRSNSFVQLCNANGSWCDLQQLLPN